MNPEDMEASRRRYIWRQVANINQLHEELASLYKTKSTDRRRLRLLWDAIEQKEAELFLDGYDTEGVQIG